MKRILSVVLAIALVTVLAGAALAFMGPGARPMGMGGGAMGMGPGHGAWGAGPGPTGCPGMTGTGPATPAQITEEKAKEVAKEYVEKYFQGFTIERVLPFTGMRGHTMYTVELKGPKGETRTLHVNPWGNVMPFGGPVTFAR
jgi:hypothetical protein